MSQQEKERIEKEYKEQAVAYQRQRDIRELKEILAIAGEAKITEYLKRIGSDLTIEDLR